MPLLKSLYEGKNERKEEATEATGKIGRQPPDHEAT
tara:strand:- start:268 stop:375 length:108 start_codon:yes stop_codon:yes gene_type:complete